MKKSKLLVLITIITLCLGACKNSESLQQYYVENKENNNFIAVDIPVSLLNVEEIELDQEEKEAYKSIRKMNILAYKMKGENDPEYAVEKKRVLEILKDDTYKELMKFNSRDIKVTVKYIGDDTSIDEVILFGTKKEFGFGLVRLLGDDMKPEKIVKLMEVVKKSDFESKALGGLEGFLKDI
ncbi:DUF4252 domain-containing protein [Ascidiimonas sp. W6]|uniref:DUF4252 domain-containing protein n=1 Tax=Ascidiimonas meishanensis TaxID=3128903 RepID=UPI0030ECD58E